MPTVNIACTADATVVQDQASKNFSQSKESVVRATSPEKNVFEYYDLRQIPALATVTKAELVHYQSAIATSANRTVSAYRVNGAWLESKVTYATQPNAVNTPASVSFNGPGSANRAWTIDVTALVQLIVNGAAYTGFKIKSNSTSELRLQSRSNNKPPVLVVTYTTAPSQPTMCSPFDGASVLEARPTFSIDFRDISGDDKTLQAVQFQFDDVEDFETITHDSGEIPADAPQWVPDFDLVIDEPTYWRGRVQDGDDNWSEYSEPRLVTRRTPPTVELTNPGDPPADIVTEPTPPFSHELTVGYTQVAYRYRVLDLLDPLAVYWDSTKTTSAADTVTPPDGALALTAGTSYLVQVDVWVAELGPVSGGAPHATATRVFTFEPDAGVDPVEDLIFTPDPAGRPEAAIGWTETSGVPDKLAIFRRPDRPGAVDVLVFTTDNVVDLQVSPGQYAWSDRDFPPGTPQIWTVARIVNGVMSAGNPTVSGTLTLEGLWLSTLDGTHQVRFGTHNPVDWDANEVTELVMPLGAKNPSLVTGSIFGRRGSLNGLAEAYEGQDYEEMLEHLEALLDVDLYPRGTALILTAVDTRTKVMWWDVVRDHREEYVEKIRVRAQLQELVD